MRTLVRGGWVVGFARGGHTLVPDGVVVCEDDRIVHVGRRFDGRADAEIDARGMLVCPGFIDTHVHSGHRASHRLITDTGRPEFYGQPFLEISVPREGTRVGGDPRYARPTDADAEAGNRLLATFTVAEMLRNGITTFMEFGSQLGVQEALLGEVEREHRMTPVELLESVGLLGPDLTIGHGNLIADNALLNYSGGRELELMGRHRVTVSHCPVNIARRARYLDSWPKYRVAGVNLALGSDTYPRDLIMQMRIASYFGKVMSHNLFAASAAEVFEAATLGGPRPPRRHDLGRLAAGAKADIVVIDLATRDALRFGPVRDPVKALVECGIGDDVVTVIVDGVVRMRDRVIPGVDLAALRRQAQEAGETVWRRVQEWDPLGRTAEEMSPWSFPLMKED